MKLLDRHISQAVLLAMIVVLGVVVALDFIFSLVDELGEAGVNYHAGQRCDVCSADNPYQFV